MIGGKQSKCAFTLTDIDHCFCQACAKSKILQFIINFVIDFVHFDIILQMKLQEINKNEIFITKNPEFN
jgi:hypothetical protein